MTAEGVVMLVLAWALLAVICTLVVLAVWAWWEQR